CLAYGEGTTYRALADIARGLDGDPRLRIEELLADDEQALSGALGAVGLSDAPAQPQETAWALRSLLERIARDRPLVVAVEDIHWAEPALLDLLENVVAFSTESPILLVCLTRPELLEHRPEWVARHPRRSVLSLDALTDAEARELVRLLGAEHLADQITRRAEGNPLFVEQLVAVDARGNELPASVQAVLAARIDRLDPGERMLLQRAAVEGRTFHAGAVETLLPAHERGRIGVRLVALARKGLVGTDDAEFARPDALRFTHALIREAAYAGIPKSLRVELHAGVAEWLEAGAAVADEIVGYHLEQACRFAGELGPRGPLDRARAARAVDRFEAASQVARTRGDPAAAIALLERALALLDSDDAIRGRLLPTLGASLFEAGRLSDAALVLDEAIARAPEPRVEALARVEREFVRLKTETGVGTEARARRVADAALPILEREDDDHGQSRAWCLLAEVAWQEGSIGGADEAWSRAADCARRLRDERELLGILTLRASAIVYGPTPVDEAIRQCEETRRRVRRGPVAAAITMTALATLHALRGDTVRARRLLREANAAREKLGDMSSSMHQYEAFIDMLAGEPARAVARLRGDFETLTRIGDRAMLATAAALLAQAVYALGERHEAERLCLLAEDTAAADDIVTHVIWRGVRAKVLADAGSSGEALPLAREAVRLAASTDMLTDHADALFDLAHVLDIAGDRAEAQKTFRDAAELYARKGNKPGVAKAAAALAEAHAGSVDA
ncbi:MAG: hypothetical protein QOH12_3102, partial [Solirubrobacteraceae bacterium]|nr:hypothetical protein [Solirubrobacteraceae bacterium]